jgi:hypothetical protein
MEHLDTQMLGSYHEGRLSPSEETAVQHHLASCRTCTDLALELGEFLDGNPEPTPKVSREASALARRLLRETRPAATPVFWKPASWQVAAAVLSALLVGIVSYNFGLSRATLRVGPMTAERLKVIELTDSEQRGTAGAGEQTVARPEGPTAIVLTSGFVEPFGRYQVRILSESGEERARVTLPADRTGTLYLAISGEDLSPGRYLFEIRSASGGEEVATLLLGISPEEGGV